MNKSSFNIWRGGARALQLFAKIWLCACMCVFAMGCKSGAGKINLHNSEKYLYVCGAGYFKINQDATNINYKTETKIRGRRTAESAAVLSRHRFGVSSSDLPSLFNNQILNVMLDTKKDKSTKSAKVGTYVPEIKNLHAGSRQSVINGLYNRPISQLVHDFMVEMDAKNTAYYFILENGHFDAFADYCKNQRKEVCHVNA